MRARPTSPSFLSAGLLWRLARQTTQAGMEVAGPGRGGHGAWHGGGWGWHGRGGWGPGGVFWGSIHRRSITRPRQSITTHRQATILRHHTTRDPLPMDTLLGATVPAGRRALMVALRLTVWRRSRTPITAGHPTSPSPALVRCRRPWGEALSDSPCRGDVRGARWHQPAGAGLQRQSGLGQTPWGSPAQDRGRFRVQECATAVGPSLVEL
jgi:hypothetical protein